MKKWVKTALFIAPLAVGTSVYAFASDRSSAQASVQISEAQPGDTVTASNVSVPEVPSIANPFIVNRDQIIKEVEALQNGQQPTGSQTVNIEQIRKLHINAKTDRGELKLEYLIEGNGTPRLNGQIGELKVSLTGDKAKEALNTLLNHWALFDSLQKVIDDPNAKLNGKMLLALSEFELDTVDGKKITLDEQKLKANAEQAKQQAQPDAEPKQVQPVSQTQPQQLPQKQNDNKHDDGNDKDKNKQGKHADNGKHLGNNHNEQQGNGKQDD